MRSPTTCTFTNRISTTTSHCTSQAQSVRHARTPYRCIHTTQPLSAISRSQRSREREREAKSNEQAPPDLGALDMLRNTAAPATSIDACTSDGFAFNNQMKISGSGVLLVGGEVFRWWPWAQGGSDGEMKGRLLNTKGQWEVKDSVWGVLELLYPKPDLLIIGTGPQTTPIAPSVRRYLNDLGIRLEIQDTRNAAAQFNLLATERGVGQVAAALVPIGRREGR
ncbi:hypothetical protein CC80DRAFT_551868 [Byssothecium circinans]|uniref:NADH dehydrogenase [ubiquinone] 1 alpha subcomplex assembly factor 3 n=1 Tax=Byssothecium circinans TaxID=147558 RepID=A0A6A5TMA2_9PLEO|nr:hypothetical protein CC80DRAFT_551868 [Byssothecium circinans]